MLPALPAGCLSHRQNNCRYHACATHSMERTAWKHHLPFHLARRAILQRFFNPSQETLELISVKLPTQQQVTSLLLLLRNSRKFISVPSAARKGQTCLGWHSALAGTIATPAVTATISTAPTGFGRQETRVPTVRSDPPCQGRDIHLLRCEDRLKEDRRRDHPVLPS